MLSILIPDASELNVNDFVKEVEALGIAHEIIISRDRERRGKGWALREALKEAKGNLVAFIDGDGDIKPRMFRRLLPFLEDFDVVVGSKRITNSPRRRKVMTRLTRWWFKVLFGVKVDTQTGIKIFRRNVLELLPHGTWEASGFVFDAEIIARLQKKRVRMIEVPIEAEIRRQVKFKTIIRIFMESLWLKWRLLFR